MASKGIPEKFHPPVTQLFSTMRRIKSYLRSTMLQPRLNYLMILNIYKEQLDDVDLSSIANVFVCGSEHRMHVFGKF